MLKKIIFITLFVVMFHNAGFSQQKTKTSNPLAIYVELGGNALLYSINLDYSLNVDGTNLIAVRAGYSSLREFKAFELITFLPLEVLGLIHISKNANYFEIGPGITFFSASDKRMIDTESIRYFTIRSGYRYQKQTGGFIFRAGLVLMYDYYTSNPDDDVTYKTWNAMPGISIGLSF